MELQINIYEYLKIYHVGEKNAVMSKELENAFGCKGTELRRAINGLRCQGKPICSCNKGYYYAASQTEIKNTVKNLEMRVSAITSAIEGLRGWC